MQGLIERCMQQYMTQVWVGQAPRCVLSMRDGALPWQTEIVTAIQQQANIDPGFTCRVWQQLEEQNPEHFFAYNVRLRLRDQIVAFNYLVCHASSAALLFQQSTTSLRRAGGAAGDACAARRRACGGAWRRGLCRSSRECAGTGVGCRGARLSVASSGCGSDSACRGGLGRARAGCKLVLRTDAHTKGRRVAVLYDLVLVPGPMHCTLASRTHLFPHCVHDRARHGPPGGQMTSAARCPPPPHTPNGNVDIGASSLPQSGVWSNGATGCVRSQWMTSSNWSAGSASK